MLTTPPSDYPPDGVSYPVPGMTSHPVSNHSPFSHVKLEPADAYSMGSPGSDSSSPFSYQSYSVPQAQPTIQESPGVDPLDMIASDIAAAGSNQPSPYSTLERSPYSSDSPHYANSSGMLQLPPDSQEVWSNGGSPVPDPRYSPEPGAEHLFPQQPVDMTHSGASPVPQTVQVQPEFLPMKTFPNRSPVEVSACLLLPGAVSIDPRGWHGQTLGGNYSATTAAQL